MENQRTPTPASSSRSSYWVNESLADEWNGLDLGLPLPLKDVERAHWKVDLTGNQILLTDRKQTLLQLPKTTTNLRFLSTTLASYILETQGNEGNWENQALIDLAELGQPLFFGALVDREAESYLRNLSSTISLKSGLDGFFSVRRFREFKLGVLLVHQKGESTAWQIGAGQSLESMTRAIDLERFNALNQAVKKSKTGQFTSQQEKWSWLPVSGVFLAQTFAFRKFNAIWVISREEFLSCQPEEVREFQAFSQMMGVWLEGLIEVEFSDLRLTEIMWALEHCPLPIVLQDSQGMAIFTNAAFSASPQDMELAWIPIGRNFEMGVGKRDDWDAMSIDVLHGHKIALLGDLFNTLRHELSNPLFGLGLASDLLLSTDTPDDVTPVLKEIKKNIVRSQQIISNLSKLYSSDLTINTCDLSQAIDETMTLAKSELKGIRHSRPQLDASQPIVVEGRPLLVVQILFNLLVNSAQALRHSVEKPEIHIEIVSTEKTVSLTVRDNGPGLPLVIRENLFRPFYTTKQKGNGLGLALSRDLALKIGGELNYIDTPAGATFVLKLKRI